MTKKKTGTTTKTRAAPEPSAAQIHMEQTQRVVDAFPGKALEILAADLLAVDAPGRSTRGPMTRRCCVGCT